MKHAESKLMQPWVEIQAVAEPAKRHVLKKKDDEAVHRQEDEEGDGDPPEEAKRSSL